MKRVPFSFLLSISLATELTHFSMCFSRDCKLALLMPLRCWRLILYVFFYNLINRIQSTSVCFYIYERIISISDPYTLILAASKNVKKNVKKRRSFYGIWFTFYSRSFFFVSGRTFSAFLPPPGSHPFLCLPRRLEKLSLWTEFFFSNRAVRRVDGRNFIFPHKTNFHQLYFVYFKLTCGPLFYSIY